jgi:mono/diheme cytochrome c family protein
MSRRLEMRALGWAMAAASLSMGSAWLASISIKTTPGFSAATTSSAGSFSEIIISPELAGQGHQLYDMGCSQCHGDDATGDEGPDLRHLPISNAHIAVTIKKGIKGEMPAFAKKYDDKQIAALVSYLRSLR